jgi:hypothetical protein
MNGAVSGMAALIWQSVVAPRAAARILIGLNLPRLVLWQALVLVTVVSVLLVALTQGPMPEIPADTPQPIEITPFAYAMILGSSLVLLVFALYYTGQALGGTGQFTGALAIVIWLEVLAMCVRLAQVVLSVFGSGPELALSLVGMALLFWALLNFIAELHDFDSIGRALLTLVLAVFGISLGVALILSAIGVAGGPIDV